MLYTFSHTFRYLCRFHLYYSTAKNIDSCYVKIVEVGPRDGLQAEKECLSLDQRFKLIDLLSKTGLTCIEVGSFVSAKWVPQMAQSDQLYTLVKEQIGKLEPHIQFPMLVPNQQGWTRACQVQAKEIALFTAASETFNMKNINCSIDESFDRFIPIVQEAKEKGVWIRGYISCVMGCPYEGQISIKQVIKVAHKMLYDLHVDELSLGDTIGVGTAGKMKSLLKELKQNMDVPISNQIAVHCHDTYGQALSNIWVALEEGIRIIDSSVAGLGGCPYAPGASGNVATEDVIYMLHGSGMRTNVDMNKLLVVDEYITKQLGSKTLSKTAKAMISKQKCSIK